MYFFFQIKPKIFLQTSFGGLKWFVITKFFDCVNIKSLPLKKSLATKKRIKGFRRALLNFYIRNKIETFFFLVCVV